MFSLLTFFNGDFTELTRLINYNELLFPENKSKEISEIIKCFYCGIVSGIVTNVQKMSNGLKRISSSIYRTLRYVGCYLSFNVLSYFFAQG